MADHPTEDVIAMLNGLKFKYVGHRDIKNLSDDFIRGRLEGTQQIIQCHNQNIDRLVNKLKGALDGKEEEQEA